jgi:hypothetical protein
MTVEDPVASTDLQNPADALEFLASVAERDGNGHSNGKSDGNGNGAGRERLPSMQIGPGGMYGRSLLNPISPADGRGRSETSMGGGGARDKPSQGMHGEDQRSASATMGGRGTGEETSERPQTTINFPPLQKGLLSLEMIQVLLYR